jgi:hypothetical protein
MSFCREFKMNQMFERLEARRLLSGDTPVGGGGEAGSADPGGGAEIFVYGGDPGQLAIKKPGETKWTGWDGADRDIGSRPNIIIKFRDPAKTSLNEEIEGDFVEFRIERQNQLYSGDKDIDVNVSVTSPDGAQHGQDYTGFSGKSVSLKGADHPLLKRR